MKDAPLFAVYRNGKRIMHTDDPKCIPDEKTIKQMKAAGCKVIYNGKTYRKDSKNGDKGKCIPAHGTVRKPHSVS